MDETEYEFKQSENDIQFSILQETRYFSEHKDLKDIAVEITENILVNNMNPKITMLNNYLSRKNLVYAYALKMKENVYNVGMNYYLKKQT